MSKLETNTIDNISGSSTLTIGDSNASTISIPKNITLGASGTTITVPSGATLDLSNATQTGVGGTNTPAFEAYTDTTTSISNDTTTKMTFANTVHNTGSGWDTTNNKFLPTTAGKYYVYGCVEGFAGASTQLTDARPMIYKNGSMVRQTPFFFQDSRIRYGSFFVDGTYDLNGSSDYIELYFSINSGSTPVIYEKYFGAYRILT